MTLDEAIEYAKWVANNCEGKCAEEHGQLAEWLREARGAEMAAKWYTEKIGKMARELHDAYDENETLRELVYTIWLAGDFSAFLGVDELEVRMRELGIEVG